MSTQALSVAGKRRKALGKTAQRSALASENRIRLYLRNLASIYGEYRHVHTWRLLTYRFSFLPRVENIAEDKTMCKELTIKFGIPNMFWEATGWDGNGYFWSRPKPDGQAFGKTDVHTKAPNF